MSDSTGIHTNDSTIGAPFIAALLSFIATAVLALLVTPEIITAVVLIPAVVAALCVGSVAAPGTRAYALGIGAALGGAFAVGVWVATHIGQDAAAIRIVFGWAFTVAIYLVAAAVVATIVAWCATRIARASWILHH